MTYIVPNYYPERPAYLYPTQVERVVTYTTPAISHKYENELRTEVLTLAHQELLMEFSVKEQNYHAMLEVFIQSHGNATPIESLKDFIKENSPKMYSIDDLVARFDQLYAFVLNKTTKIKP